MMNLPWDHRLIDAADLPPGEPDFPQRRWCFGRDWLNGGLAAALAAAGHAQADAWREAVTLDNVWYAPGKQLVVVHRAAGGARLSLVYRAPQAGPEPSPVGGLWLADAQARAWPWPADPGGLDLARWSDAGWAAAQLRRHAALDAPALHAPALDGRLRCRVLSYLPGQRCALRWACAGDEAPGWVMKAQAGRDLGATHRTLWQRPERRFVLPEPLGGGQDPADGGPWLLRWEAFVPGERLESAAARIGWRAVLQEVAVALADLHRSVVPDLPVQDEAAVLARLRGKVLKRVKGALPALAPQVAEMVEALVADCPRAPGPRRLLHGDLHTGNLLRTPQGSIAFIDLDNLVMGAPAYDLALLSSRLLLVGLLDPRQAAEIDDALNDWPAAYLAAGGEPQAVAAYPWYLATLLIARQIKTCVRHHAPGLPRLAEALLQRARTVLRA